MSSNEIRCECGKLNPNITHWATVQHNKYLFIHRYNSVIEDFLENEFERIFRPNMDTVLIEVREWEKRRSLNSNNTELYNSIIDKTSVQVSNYVIKKVGSNSNRIRGKVVEWVQNYLRANYEVLDIIEWNERV